MTRANVNNELEPQDSDSQLSRSKVVIVGASNVTRSLPTVISTAQQLIGSPIDFFIAAGHGRSYGRESTVLVRTLPAIVECGLWSELEQQSRISSPATSKETKSDPKIDKLALVSDIGNDILYGADNDQIMSWVDRCLQLLTEFGYQITITELPVESLRKLSQLRFFIFRTILFPASRLRISVAVEQAVDLNHRIRVSAKKYDAKVVAPNLHWYGIDPIHVRKRFESEAWQTILGEWPNRHPTASPRPLRWTDKWRIRLIKPQKMRVFSKTKRQSQPAINLANGTTISSF